MPTAVSSDLKERIVQWYHEDTYTMQDIATLARVSIGLVSKTIRLHREFGQVVNPFSRRTGRPRTLNDGDLDYLAAILLANPGLYLDELHFKLGSVRNVHVSISVISRALVELQLTRKKITKTAAERDEQLRTIWEADMAQYLDPDVFVALDESAVDNRTVQRSHGRSAAGTPCVQRTTFIRGTRYSILPALTTEGIVALDIFEGSVTKERFLDFFREQVVSKRLRSASDRTVADFIPRRRSSILTPESEASSSSTTVPFITMKTSEL